MNTAFRALVEQDIPVFLGDFGVAVSAGGRTTTGLLTTADSVESDAVGLPTQVLRSVLQVERGALGALTMGTFVTIDGRRHEIRSPLRSQGEVDSLIDEWEVAAR